MMSVCTDFDAKNLSVPEREELFKAVITTQSYLVGSDRTMFSLSYFTRLWFKFQLRLSTNPHLLHECFCPMFSRNKESYVDMICKLFPTLLHSLYRYSTSVLGCSANTKTLVEVMNRKSKMEYAGCPIRSNLSLNTYHFWKFFKKFGGRMIRHTTKPRLSEEQKLQRVVWAREMKHNVYTHIDDDNFHLLLY